MGFSKNIPYARFRQNYNINRRKKIDKHDRKGNEGFLAQGICISNTYYHMREHDIVQTDHKP